MSTNWVIRDLNWIGMLCYSGNDASPMLLSLCQLITSTDNEVFWKHKLFLFLTFLSKSLQDMSWNFLFISVIGPNSFRYFCQRDKMKRFWKKYLI
jgi:hypothetical protein